MRSKRYLAVLLVLFYASAWVFGAAGAEENDAPETANIKFVGFAGSVGGFEARAAAFMETHPNINVEVQGVPASSWAELMQAITINIAGGDVPDIADVASEGQRAFAANNIIIPLDDYIARDQDEMQPLLNEIHPRLMDAMKYNGLTYALPTVWNNMVMYYNKNVLADAGVDEPGPDWTIDDFIDICQQVVASNNGVDDKWGYAFYNGYFVTLVPWMLVSGGNVLTDDWTQSRLTDPATVRAVELLYDFVHEYGISPPLDAGIGDFDLFVQDRLAFMGAGMWQVNGLKNAGFDVADYDVVGFPRVATNDTIMGIGGAPIFTASENKDAAWEFAKFLSSVEFQETFIVEDGWSIPSVRSAAELMLGKDFFPSNGNLFYNSADNGILVPAPEAYGLIETTLLREFGAAMANEKTVAEALSTAHAIISEALAD